MDETCQMASRLVFVASTLEIRKQIGCFISHNNRNICRDDRHRAMANDYGIANFPITIK